MKAYSVIFGAVLLLTGGTVCGHAGVKSYRKLSLDEQIELQESERRMAICDREWMTLDGELKHRKISTGDYQQQARELMSHVYLEASFQNGILEQRPISLELPDAATNVLRTIGKYSLGIAAGVLEGIARGGGNFSP